LSLFFALPLWFAIFSGGYQLLLFVPVQIEFDQFVVIFVIGTRGTLKN